jgi:hypothetical protein
MRYGFGLLCLTVAAAGLACSTLATTGPSPTETATPDADGAPSAGPRIDPDDFVYLGAFRLPEGTDRPQTFAYGGAAMTFNPAGDPGGATDGFPGSLFITGHDRLPYGELPDGDQVAEVSIPAPTIAEHPADLARAEFLESFHEITQGRFDGYAEVPRVALLWLETPATGPLLHLAFGQHFAPDPLLPTHGWIRPDLSSPETQGGWFLGDWSFYAVTGYLLEIPAEWAAEFTGGLVVGTGRFRDGGWSGMGPTLYAYRPWLDDGGAPPSGARLDAVELLHYQTSDTTPGIEHSLTGYQHPDEWEGAAWLTTDSGASAVLFAGTKSTGDRYWYGFLDDADPRRPCVEAALLGQFPLCRMADGTECPPAELAGCDMHGEYRGWWSSSFDAQFLLYDPAELASVARGALQPWEPQPYATVDIDEYLLLNPDGVEQEMLGTGDQRRYRIGEVAYDRRHGLVYVLELFADGAQPVVHVWHVQ